MLILSSLTHLKLCSPVRIYQGKSKIQALRWSHLEIKYSNSTCVGIKKKKMWNNPLSAKKCKWPSIKDGKSVGSGVVVNGNIFIKN